ncbi:hypothetical protein CTZ27_32830 [Streptomyces griseocarneus]|nr:hypothetical protein CTZ27_32830 [Streptomyces griseocarneus]
MQHPPVPIVELTLPKRTMPRPVFRHRLAAAGGLVLAAALALTGCTGDDKTSTSSTTSPSVSSSVSTTAIPSPTPTNSPTPSASPTHRPSPEAPDPTEAAPAPAPKHTRGSATGSSGNTTCEILSNAGNCYKAGQFCRSGDVGASTHDAHGRLITCGAGSGRPRWHQ